MRRFGLVLIGLVVALAANAATAAPPGATAKCRDGTYSYSKHRSGTCSHHGGVARWLVGGKTAAGVNTGRTIMFARRTKSSGCTRSALPDRRCSPGAYYAKLTQRVICSPSFHTGTIRNVPQSEKFSVEREYGRQAAFYGRSIEIDHIVPLELGGSNSIGNLYFEPGRGNASYHIKDQLENRAKAWVCSGRLALGAARRGFATDWETLYRRLYGHAPN